MQSVKHNKLKNTGILFELLVRLTTADTLSLKENSPALSMLRQFMNSNTELGKELILYRAFFNNPKPLSETRALDLLNLVCERRRKLNDATIKIEKYNLISEIKKHYDLKEFLSDRIPSYKTYASIYKQFSALDPSDRSDVEQISKSRFTILEHLGGKQISKHARVESSITTAWKAQDEDLRVLSYKILIERFNEKYSGLSTKQKNLLRVYINNVSNTGVLRSYVMEEISTLMRSINNKISRVPNKVLKIKLDEVVLQLKKMQSLKEIKSNHITSLLISYQLDKELDNLQPKSAG